MTTELERTAYHEAGHAVVAHFVGAAVMSLSIVPTDFEEGRLSMKGGVLDGDKQLAIGYAGREAEILATGTCGDGWAVDNLVMQHLCSSWFVDERDRDEAIEFAQEDARNILRRYWSAVEALAQALLEHKLVIGADVRAIILRAEVGHD